MTEHGETPREHIANALQAIAGYTALAPDLDEVDGYALAHDTLRAVACRLRLALAGLDIVPPPH